MLFGNYNQFYIFKCFWVEEGRKTPRVINENLFYIKERKTHNLDIFFTENYILGQKEQGRNMTNYLYSSDSICFISPKFISWFSLYSLFAQKTYQNIFKFYNNAIKYINLTLVFPGTPSKVFRSQSNLRSGTNKKISHLHILNYA